MVWKVGFKIGKVAIEQVHEDFGEKQTIFSHLCWNKVISPFFCQGGGVIHCSAYVKSHCIVGRSVLLWIPKVFWSVPEPVFFKMDLYPYQSLI